MTTATNDQLITAVKTLALECSTHAGKMQRALLNMSAATGSLRAAGGGTGSRGSDMPDPTGTAAFQPDTAAADRKRIAQVVVDMLKASKELSILLGGWAPADEQQEAIWCPNHQLHGMDEPRAPGRRHCDFCDGFNREHKTMPTRWILDVKERRRLTSADVAYELEQQRARKRDARARRKAEQTAQTESVAAGASSQGA